MIPLSKRARRKRTRFDRVAFLRKVDVGIYVDERHIDPFRITLTNLLKAMYPTSTIQALMYAPNPLLQMITVGE